MQLLRLLEPGCDRPGVGISEGGVIRRLRGAPTFAELMQLPRDEVRRRCEDVEPSPVAAGQALAPIDGRMEVWAAGVTYARSMDARLEESALPSVYERVYRADRPELFFKSVAWRVVTDGDPIGIRTDSELSVPEAELAVLVNRHGDIVGYTACNDVTSRAIEGENPLYLPQAKIYAGSCAIAPSIRPWWELPDPYALGLRVAVRRAGRPVWEASTNTSLLKRRIDELVSWLFAQQTFPDGVILSTGTSMVPEFEFTLEAGDEVDIEIDEVGVLRNPVVAAADVFTPGSPQGRSVA
jgi:2-dehydro-3-deoxy-D-arabinonate dehydratase